MDRIFTELRERAFAYASARLDNCRGWLVYRPDLQGQHEASTRPEGQGTRGGGPSRPQNVCPGHRPHTLRFTELGNSFEKVEQENPMQPGTDRPITRCCLMVEAATQ